VRATSIVLVSAIAFIIALIVTPLAIRLGIYLGIADAPGGRRTHARLTSRLGAIPLFVAFVIGALLAHAIAIPSTDPNEPTRFWGMLIGAGVIFVAGLIDDKWQLSATPQFIGQLLATVIAIAALIFIERFKNPLNGIEAQIPFILTVALTLVWFVGAMNTVNFVDGVDGLSATISFIVSAVIAAHMLREGQYSVALLPIALCGALLGFLVFNLPPAKIFLGSGAQFLGYLLACLSIIAGAKVALLLLVMSIPIVDVAWQIFDRTRRKQSPMRGDRGHLHLRLVDTGWSAKKIVRVYALLGVTLGALALLIEPPQLKLIVFGLIALGVALALARLSRATKK